MDAQRWERIQALFHEAAERPAAEQRVFVEARCADEPSLAPQVLAMLAEDARGGSLLDRPLGHVAGGLLEDSSADAVPKQFGPYRLLHVLGEGGMGVVYLAERADLGSRVAIKLLRDAWLTPARRERFGSEQRTLAQLSHPAIARLYDADTLPDGTPWFAMEYVAGVPLNEYCAEHACSVPKILELFRAVCEAVLHAHQRAVIHRDLKPSNILVTDAGEVKLIDFGIAKPLEAVDQGERTRTGLRLMTPAYASPEQIRGGPLGVHTDIYSLGVILYELLAGRPPFDLAGRTPSEVDRMITEQEPERPSVAARKTATRLADGVAQRGRPEAPGSRPAPRSERGVSWADLDVLCQTAMQKDPSRRYRTVDSLLRDLDHYRRGEPLEAREDSLGYRLGKFVRRHRRAVTAAAAVILGVVGLVGFYTLRLTKARNVAIAEAQRTRRIQDFMNELFEGGDDAAGPSDSLRVITLIDRGAQEARSLASEPAVQAELYQTLGTIYQKLGEFDRADSLLTASLDRRRKLVGPEHPDVARSMIALGLLRADQSEFDASEKLVRDALAKLQRVKPPDPALTAQAMTALALVLQARGTYDEAIRVLGEAARLDAAAHLPPGELAATLTLLANCHFYAGHYALSDSLNRRVLDMDRAQYGERHPHVASDLINLGAIQQETGRYAEAERFYRQALDVYRSWYGPDHYETAASLTMLGRALIPQGRFDEAAELLHQALAIRERIYGPNDPNVASTLNELGLAALHEGRLDEAETDFRRMVDIYRTVYHDKHELIGVALSNLGSVYTERKQYAEAERLFRDAIRRYGETLPADHPYTAIARIKLGRALLRAGRPADAEPETLAGYRIESQQSDPAGRWLQSARQDLVAEYEALKRPGDAATYRRELAEPAAAAH